MTVKISIVTPSFNQGRFLEETIRSVLSQRDDVHEYFVIDGGSTDNSVDVIRKYEHGIDRWISERDRGQSDAIDKGFRLATGDILFWLNSDDVLLPNTLARVRRAFDEHPDWDALTGYSVWIDAASRILKMHRIPRESIDWLKWGVLHVCQQTCFFRSDLYHDVGRLDLGLHCTMDTELWCRMFRHGARWGHLPEYLGGFRLHDEMKGRTWIDRYAAEDSLLRSRFPEFFGSPARVAAGAAGYRASQLASGRYLQARWDTLSHKRSRLTEVFGDWHVSEHSCLAGSQ
jgi:glycosyltransferase involved in cell wall biosynthesis